MDPRATRIGVVLAGGQSRRMGQDKARMTFDPREGGAPPRVGTIAASSASPHSAPRLTWLERTLELLRPHVAECWVVGREVTSEDCPSWNPLPSSRLDGRPGNGPLAGMETALEIAGSRDALVVACDLPDLGRVAIESLEGAVAAASKEATSGEVPPSAFAFRKPVGTAAQGDTDCRGMPRVSRTPGANMEEEIRLAGLLFLLRPDALPTLRALLDRDERRVERFLREVHTRWIDADAGLLRLLRNANRPEDLRPDP